jgi:hypothetical protein
MSMMMTIFTAATAAMAVPDPCWHGAVSHCCRSWVLVSLHIGSGCCRFCQQSLHNCQLASCNSA